MKLLADYFTIKVHQNPPILVSELNMQYTDPLIGLALIRLVLLGLVLLGLVLLGFVLLGLVLLGFVLMGFVLMGLLGFKHMLEKVQKTCIHCLTLDKTFYIKVILKSVQRHVNISTIYWSISTGNLSVGWQI